MQRYVASAAGIVAALIVAELALRTVASPYPDDPAFAGRARPGEIRQFHEGLAVSHYGPDGARLTGNPRVPGAPVGVILGDSHVQARQVADDTTMGAVVERLGRAQGRPVNVVQLAWDGASIPMYLAVAASTVRPLDPSWVAVFLSPGDLTSRPLVQSYWWRMKVEPDFSVRLVPVAPASARGFRAAWRPVYTWVMRNSALATELALVVATADIIRRRPMAPAAQTVLETPGETSAEETRVPRASVRALKRAYGTRLLLVYVPAVDGTSTAAVDVVEGRLLDSCREEEVRCLSTRAAMLAERDTAHRLTRGFHNTAPGQGHLNETGHAIVGHAIWRAVSADLAGAAPR